MAEGSKAQGPMDPKDFWRQGSEAFAKIWSNVLDGGKGTFIDPYGLYQPWLKSPEAAREQVKNSYFQSTDKNTPAIAEAYHANPFELMMANLNNTLEYGQRLLNIKTPIEFIELSTSHARKQLELIIKQTAELRWIVHCR